jgi:hypothetical protein
VALAVQAAWILAAATRRHAGLAIVGWLTSVWLCAGGLTEAGFRTGATSLAVLLQVLGLFIARTAIDPSPWPDRLARWRRARQRVVTELRMGEGLLPWVRTTLSRLWVGQADRPSAAGFDRMLVEIADAQTRMHWQLNHLVLPDALRQAMSTAAARIANHAATTTAELSLSIERRALDEAAACRDLVEDMTELPAAQRERLSSECESVLLGLAVTGRPTHRPTATQGIAEVRA